MIFRGNPRVTSCYPTTNEEPVLSSFLLFSLYVPFLPLPLRNDAVSLVNLVFEAL